MIRYAYREIKTSGIYDYHAHDIWVYEEYSHALLRLQVDLEYYQRQPQYKVQVVADDHIVISDGETCIQRFIVKRYN